MLPPQRKMRRTRRPRPAPLLSAEQRHERDCNRAFHWGERYARRVWVRRPPPRFRSHGPHDDAGIELSAAFYRGYDSMNRSMRRRSHVMPWRRWAA